jgi:hypothetical protein
MKTLAIAAVLVALGLVSCTPPPVRMGPPSDCDCYSYHARYSPNHQGVASPWADSWEWHWGMPEDHTKGRK